MRKTSSAYGTDDSPSSCHWKTSQYDATTPPSFTVELVLVWWWAVPNLLQTWCLASGCPVPFTSDHYHTGLIGFPFGEVLLPPQRNPGALIEFWLCTIQFAWLAGGSKLLQLADDGDHCAHWGPSKQKNVFSNPSSGLSLEIIPVLSWRSTGNSIHRAWFAQHATVGPYMNRYVPFQIMSIQLNRNKQNTLCWLILFFIYLFIFK